MRNFLCLILLSLALAPLAVGQNSTPAPAPDPTLVQRALAAELRAAQDTSHPMQYQLHKWSPRLTTTKNMVETMGGTVALLVALNGQPLDAAQRQKEQNRLQGLLADPGKQRHRELAQEQDTARALKVLRALPRAFIYRYVGRTTANGIVVERFAFTPNPGFNAPDLETQVLTALSGEIWIDPVSVRVAHLEGRLVQDVDFGWGILGRLYKGGWITIDHADVGGGVWRVVRFQMNMSARVVFKTRTFETSEETSHFVTVPAGLDYRQGIALLEKTAASGQ